MLLSPLFAQLVDGSHSGDTEQDAQVLQVGFPRCSLGTWGQARLGCGDSPQHPWVGHGSRFGASVSAPWGLGRGWRLQPLPSALVWKRHQVPQVPLLSAVTS